MATGQDGWYIAEPTGETTGPMSRAEMTAQFRAARHSAAALCWHVDVAEWHPLAKVAGAGLAAEGTDAARERVSSQPVATLPGASEAEADARAAVDVLARDVANAAASARGAVEAERQRHASVASARADADPDRQRQRAERKRMKREAVARLAGRLPDDGKRILSHGAGAAATGAIAASAARSAASTVSEAKKSGTEYVPIALRRFAARALDTALIGLPAAALLWGGVNRFLANTDPSIAFREPEFLALVLLAPLALAPIEAIVLGLFGRTPGKALLGLSVERRSGGSPGLFAGIRRARDVLIRGVGLGIPVVNLIAIAASGARLVNQGATSWDERLALATRAEPIDARRTQIVLGVLIGAWFLVGSTQFQALLDHIARLPWTWSAG